MDKRLPKSSAAVVHSHRLTHPSADDVHAQPEDSCSRQRVGSIKAACEVGACGVLEIDEWADGTCGGGEDVCADCRPGHEVIRGRNDVGLAPAAVDHCELNLAVGGATRPADGWFGSRGNQDSQNVRMLEFLGYIRTAPNGSDGDPVDSQTACGIARGVTPRPVIFRYLDFWLELNVVRKDHSYGEQECESRTRSARGGAEDRVEILTQEGHLGMIRLRINRQLDIILICVGQRIDEWPPNTATLRVSSGNDLV